MISVELTAEQYEGLPDYAKGGFAEHEGKYIPVKDAALKATLDSLDKDKKALESKVGELTASEQKRLDELEEAKKQAREEAIAEAAKKGNWDEQERLLREKFEDELQRKLAEERGSVTKEFTVKQAAESLNNDIKLLASELAVDESAKAALDVLIKQRAKLDEYGNSNYFGEDGGALSITDVKAFKAELEKSVSLARLIKGKAPSSGGFAQGGGKGGGGAVTVNKAAEEAKKNRDAIGHLNAHFKEAFKR